MSTQEPTQLRTALDQLITLQKVDSDHDRVARSRAQLDSGAGHEARANAALNEADEAREACSAVSRSLKDAELELGGIEAKIKRYEDQMRGGRMTNPREVANIEREMTQLNRQRTVLDDKILNLMDQAELGRTRASECEQKAREAEQELKSQRESFRVNLQKLDAELVALADARNACAACVSDQELLKRYEALRTRPANAGVAASRVEDRHCSGCHMPVSLQDAEAVREARKVVNCENCGRILAQVD